jgi:hypothetical protein
MISKFQKEFTFWKKNFILFVNVKIDPRLWYPSHLSRHFKGAGGEGFFLMAFLAFRETWKERHLR